MLPKIVFLSLFIAIFAIFTYFGIKRFINRLDASEWAKKLFRTIVITNFLAVLGYMLYRYLDGDGDILFYILSVAVGFGFLFFVATFLYEILIFFLHITKHLKYKKYIDYTVITTLFVSLIFASFTQYMPPKLITHNIDIEHFSGKLKGVMISDLHIGGLIDQKYVTNIVKMINDQDPDIVFLCGDIIDKELDSIQEIAMELKNIKSTYGTFMVLGNHEIFHKPKEWVSFFESIGIDLLVNSSKEIKVGESFINIVGTSDPFGKDDLALDLKKSYEHISDSPVILLSHQPSVLDVIGDYKADLILSGHTHAGQIFPFGFLVLLKQPILYGLHIIEGRNIFVSSGVGYWGPPMRLFTKHEIAVFNIF